MRVGHNNEEMVESRKQSSSKKQQKPEVASAYLQNGY
jgi:hypothetical protein